MRPSSHLQCYRILTIILILQFTLFGFLPLAEGDLVNDGSSSIDPGDHWRAAIASPDYLIPFEEYDWITVEINVTSDRPVDVYILRSNEFERYQANESFRTEFSRERVNRTSFKWEKDSDYPYMYLLVDNSDNAHSNDAIPNGTAYLSYSYFITERNHEVTMRQFWMKLGLIIIVSIAAIAGGAMYYLNKY